MAVALNSGKAVVTLQGAGVPVVFAMRCNSANWIDVYYGTLSHKATVTVDYTASVSVDGLTVTLTPTAALYAKLNTLGEGYNVTVMRNTEIMSDFVTEDAAIRRKVRDITDKLYMIAQDIFEQSARSIRLPFGVSGDLSESGGLNNNVIGFDNSGNLTVYPVLENLDIATTFMADSVAVLRAADANVTAIHAILSSWHDGLGIGGGVFRVDTLDITSVDNGGTVIVDIIGRRWKRQYQGTISITWFGAKGDGTDDTTAISAAMSYASSLSPNIGYSDRRVAVDGDGLQCSISSTITVSGSISVQNLSLTALNSASWDDTVAMLRVQGELPLLTNCKLDGTLVANGIDSTAQGPVYAFIDIRGFRNTNGGYGFRNISGGPVYAFALNVVGYPLSLGAVQANRKGICYQLANADSKFVNCTGSYASRVMQYNAAGPVNFFGCHFFNGGGGSGIVQIDPIAAEVLSGICNFVGCYFDSGYVDLYSTNVQFSGCYFLYNTSNATLASRIRLYATSASQGMGYLDMAGNHFNSSNGGANLPVFTFLTSGGTWGTNTAHFSDIYRGIYTNADAHDFTTGNTLVGTVLRLGSSAVKAIIRFADAATTKNQEPSIGSAGNDLTLSALDTEFARVKSTGEFLIGKTSATANGAKLQTIDGVTLSGSGGLTNVNTLDAYQEGTFTPTLTFATPGDLAVTYSEQTGRYTRIGNRIFFQIRLTTSTFTKTTAAGNLRISGLPVAALASSGIPGGSLAMQGWTKASYTQLQAFAVGAQTYIQVYASGSGQALSLLTATDMPSGGSVDIMITGHYEVAT